MRRLHASVHVAVSAIMLAGVFVEAVSVRDDDDYRVRRFGATVA